MIIAVSPIFLGICFFPSNHWYIYYIFKSLFVSARVTYTLKKMSSGRLIIICILVLVYFYIYMRTDDQFFAVLSNRVKMIRISHRVYLNHL